MLFLINYFGKTMGYPASNTELDERIENLKEELDRLMKEKKLH